MEEILAFLVLVYSKDGTVKQAAVMSSSAAAKRKYGGKYPIHTVVINKMVDLLQKGGEDD